jgi:hypothetical protein
MRMEVHVHGMVALRPGATLTEIEAALRPWLNYVDVESLAEAKSVHMDEPGIVYDSVKHLLEVCWTGDVGKNFQKSIEEAFQLLGPYTGEAAEFELSFYHDDGEDEFTLLFVGPSAEAVFEAQRRRMTEDVANLLSRQFTDAEVRQVVGLVNQLFDQRNPGEAAAHTEGSSTMAVPPGRKHLH